MTLDVRRGSAEEISDPRREISLCHNIACGDTGGKVPGCYQRSALAEWQLVPYTASKVTKGVWDRCGLQVPGSAEPVLPPCMPSLVALV